MALQQVAALAPDTPGLLNRMEAAAAGALRDRSGPTYSQARWPTTLSDHLVYVAHDRAVLGVLDELCGCRKSVRGSSLCEKLVP